jgi:hypothetical protein
MAHRPYPNADRALRQLDRHEPAVPALAMPECLRPMVDSFARMRQRNRSVVTQFPVGEYRLSTRPVVSGDS